MKHDYVSLWGVPLAFHGSFFSMTQADGARLNPPFIGYGSSLSTTHSDMVLDGFLNEIIRTVLANDQSVFTISPHACGMHIIRPFFFCILGCKRLISSALMMTDADSI